MYNTIVITMRLCSYLQMTDNYYKYSSRSTQSVLVYIR